MPLLRRCPACRCCCLSRPQVRQQLNQRSGSAKVAVAPSRQGSTKVAVAPPSRPGSGKVAVAPAAPARSASVRGRGRQQVEEEVEDPR